MILIDLRAGSYRSLFRVGALNLYEEINIDNILLFCVEISMVETASYLSKSSSAAGKMKPIPIGTDHLNFKHQVEIMNQLEPNGKEQNCLAWV